MPKEREVLGKRSSSDESTDPFDGSVIIQYRWLSRPVKIPSVFFTRKPRLDLRANFQLRFRDDRLNQPAPLGVNDRLEAVPGA